MPRSRSRSRSRNGRREERREREEPRKESVAEAAKSGSNEQEIVSVAIRQLPADIRERLEKLFEEGLLKEGDLDLRSVTVFASLNEGLQSRVMNHMEGERIYVANARSKSGFLIATCDKAKTGCLDARGLGAIDPWRTALVAMATPKQRVLDLKSERDWIDQHDEAATIKLNVDVASVESELGVASVTVEAPLSETSSIVKAKLVAMGLKSIPANRMKLHTEPVGFLKEGLSFAYYNLDDGVKLELSERKRAGVRFRKDHTTMPKRPRTQPPPGEAAAAQKPADALQALTAGAKLPALPGIPGLPALPKLPGTAPGALPGMSPPALPPGLPGLAGTLPGLGLGGTSPGGMAALLQGIRPGLPGAGALPGGLPLPGAGTMPQLGGLGGLTLPTGGPPKAAPLALPPGGLPALDVAGGLPGLPPPGSDPKAAAIAMMAKMGGMPPMPGMPGGNMPPPGMSLTGPGAAGGAPDQSQSKAMPPVMPGSIPKMMSGPPGPLGMPMMTGPGGVAPVNMNDAIANATAKAPGPA